MGNKTWGDYNIQDIKHLSLIQVYCHGIIFRSIFPNGTTLHSHGLTDVERDL